MQPAVCFWRQSSVWGLLSDILILRYSVSDLQKPSINSASCNYTTGAIHLREIYLLAFVTPQIKLVLLWWHQGQRHRSWGSDSLSLGGRPFCFLSTTLSYMLTLSLFKRTFQSRGRPALYIFVFQYFFLSDYGNLKIRLRLLCMNNDPNLRWIIAISGSNQQHHGSFLSHLNLCI